MHLLLVSLNSLAFLYYGINCLVSKKMIAEFTRFDLTNQERKLTGILQIMGATGAMLGLMIPIIGIAAAAGLSALMLLGFRVRLKIGDSISASAPSFIFMLLNAYLIYSYWLRI